jgi:predicted acyl esterase
MVELPLWGILGAIMIAILVSSVLFGSLPTPTTTTATTLFLRVGGQLTTDAPAMSVVTEDEKAAVKELHHRMEFFHSDHAHTDYVARPGASASWSTPPLAVACKLRKGPIKTSLWIGTNAKASDFGVSLSRWTKESGWASLCGTTVSTLSRMVDSPALPGKGMIAVMANGGYSVELPLSMELPEAVELGAGDVLRVDVSGGEHAVEKAATDEQVPQTHGVVHRVWHSPNWASALHLHVAASTPLELGFTPGPTITQPMP